MERRVQLVRRDGRDVSTLYGREWGGGSENATPPSSLQAQFRSDLALINDALDDLIAQALASRDEGPAPDPWPPPRKLPPGALWARFAAARALWARFAAAGQSLAWEPGV